MNILFDEHKKDLPADQLWHLFHSVGWAKTNLEKTEDRLRVFMQPWLNSTLVVSAWDDDRLVGAVRVLSDTVFHSVIYDLLVDPKYQGKGIGKELVCRVVGYYPKSEWLVMTEKETAGFYEGLGFSDNLGTDICLRILCRSFEG